MYPNSQPGENVPVQVGSRGSGNDYDSRNTFPSSPDNHQRPGNRFNFPGSNDRPRTPEIRSVPICEESTFCEEVKGYPSDFVNKVVTYDKSITNYQNTDAMDSISQRMDVDDSESLCVSTERIVYPKAAENIHMEWQFVVNHPNFTQGVRIETCRNQGAECKMIDGFAEGYATSCEQKYIYRQLTAIATDGSIGREFFRFPASCCCHVQFTGIASRFASPFARSPRRGKQE